MVSLDLNHILAAAHQFLLEAEHPLPPQRIARHLFGPRRHEYPEAQVVVSSLLSEDPRFVETHDSCWCAREAAYVKIALEDASYAVVDLETTGSIVGVDEIIEFGAVVIKGGEIADEFSSLINVERPIPAWIERLTGIRSQDLRQAPRFEDLVPSLIDLLSPCVFVAHDIRFDLPFLRWEFSRRAARMPSVTGLCTLRVARRLWPDLPSQRLPALARHFHISHLQPHRAPADAHAAAEILMQQLAEVRETGLETLGDLFQLTCRHRTCLPTTELRFAAGAES
jgi:DNA polymerase III epsilon subunit family exonuclease